MTPFLFHRKRVTTTGPSLNQPTHVQHLNINDTIVFFHRKRSSTTPAKNVDDPPQVINHDTPHDTPNDDTPEATKHMTTRNDPTQATHPSVAIEKETSSSGIR